MSFRRPPPYLARSFGGTFLISRVMYNGTSSCVLWLPDSNGIVSATGSLVRSPPTTGTVSVALHRSRDASSSDRWIRTIEAKLRQRMGIRFSTTLTGRSHHEVEPRVHAWLAELDPMRVGPMRTVASIEAKVGARQDAHCTALHCVTRMVVSRSARDHTSTPPMAPFDAHHALELVCMRAYVRAACAASWNCESERGGCETAACADPTLPSADQRIRPGFATRRSWHVY
jgi:hypothetical protein